MPLSITILTALLFLPSVGVSAQTKMAAVHGTVQSHTGVPIPAATVLAKNMATGLSRTVSANEKGEFAIQPLDPGACEVQASRPGHISPIPLRVELRAGDAVELKFMLETGSGEPERKAESAGAEAANLSSSGTSASTSAGMSNLISEDQLAGLPLNGRSYSQLATLQSGVSDPFAGSASRGGGSGGLTISGGRATANNFLLDGTNIMDTGNLVPRSAAGVQLGSDAILQVQVFAANYGAEYGRGSGGVLNSITRSRTPQWHGTFFEYFRNSKLDARNFFDPGPEPTPFKRNQFGSTITGPLLKDRTFFMASYEGLRDRLTETVIDHFPDKMAREGRGIITDDDGNDIPIEVNPRVKPYLDLHPLPNRPSLGRGVGENAASLFLPTNENFFTVRVDHKIADRDSFFTRYSLDDASSHRSQTSFLFKTQSNSRQQYLTLVESRAIGLPRTKRPSA
ncbi:MAG: carboxypeptidase-like regulatory domain-containing protein [Acidobacteria bacterium]|nr:carboxypeptidase-like regulatory domain-containing protein [Acidobacteriota bacterium]